MTRRTYDGGPIATMDDGISFLQHQLEYIEPQIYEVRYRDIVYPVLVPVSSEAGPWATAITYESMDARTQAQFVQSSALDVPLADISMSRSTVPVEHGALGYKYTLQELREAQQLNRQLDVRRGQAVRRGVEEFAQGVCFLGDTTHSLPGFLNNADIPAGSATTGDWVATATPDQILADVNELLSGIWDTSATVELADTVLLPPTQFAHITATPRGSVNDTTILEMIQKANIYTARTGQPLMIQPLSELVGIGAGATDRMVGYRRAPDVLTFHFPMPLQFLPPQQQGLGFLVPGEFRVSGCEVRYPLACGFSDGI